MIGSIDHFVDQQISLWQEERRIAERKGIDAHAQRPTICISRQYGARGAAMGRMVAERLGFRYLLAGAGPRHRRAGARPPAGGRIAGRTGAGRHRGVGRRPDQARRVRALRLPAQPVERRADAGAPRQGRHHRPRRALPARRQDDAARARDRAARAARRAHRRSATSLSEADARAKVAAHRRRARRVQPPALQRRHRRSEQLRSRRQRRDAGRGRARPAQTISAFQFRFGDDADRTGRRTANARRSRRHHRGHAAWPPGAPAPPGCLWDARTAVLPRARRPPTPTLRRALAAGAADDAVDDRARGYGELARGALRAPRAAPLPGRGAGGVAGAPGAAASSCCRPARARPGSPAWRSTTAAAARWSSPRRWTSCASGTTCCARRSASRSA